MRLSEKMRWRIIMDIERGHMPSTVAKELKVTQRAVRRWVARYRHTGKVNDSPRSGRPTAMKADDQLAALDILLDGKVGGAKHVAMELKRLGRTAKVLSSDTIIRAARRVAPQRGIKKLKALRGKPKKLLSLASRQRRLEFCSRHEKRSWRTTMFTDRKKFPFSYPGNKVHPVTWVADGGERRAHQVNHANVVNVYAGVTPYGMTKLHVVAGTTGHKTSHITKQGKEAKNITASEYQEVLTKTLLPEGSRLFRTNGIITWTLQQDNDPTHKKALQVINEYNSKHCCSINLLKDWPASSPDLSLIENVWAILQQKMDSKGCKTFSEFKEALKNEAAKLGIDVCKRLFDGMHGRVMSCIAQAGDYTKH
jgi:transposase